MAKRAARLSWGSEDEVGEKHEPSPRKRVARSRAPPKLPLPPYKASVKQLADTDNIKASSSSANVDSAIMSRIKKCLDRANHPTTPEAEAKVALHIASRLLGQFNVSQAEVLAHESPSAQKQYAGQSIVSLQRVDGDLSKSVKKQAYVRKLYGAMNRFFDCRCYTVARTRSLEVNFYGIAGNTEAAAMSFEMVYNLIAEWARAKRGVGPRNSYCHGISRELDKISIKEKADEEAEARKAEKDAVDRKVKEEEADSQAQLARLADAPECSNEDFPPEPATSVNATGIIQNANETARHDAVDMTGPDLDLVDEDSLDVDSGSQWETEEEDDSEVDSGSQRQKDEKDDPEVDSGSQWETDEEDNSGVDSGSQRQKDEEDDSAVNFGFKREEDEETDDDVSEPDFKVEDGDGLDPHADFSTLLENLDRPFHRVSEETSGVNSSIPPASTIKKANSSPAQKQEPSTAASDNMGQISDSTSQMESVPERKWGSHMQLVSFRETAAKIAEDYIKDQGLKMRHRSGRHVKIRDWKAYEEGVRDSKKIDVRRKRIKE